METSAAITPSIVMPVPPLAEVPVTASTGIIATSFEHITNEQPRVRFINCGVEEIHSRGDSNTGKGKAQDRPLPFENGEQDVA